ncbi:hypothetical protein CVIRNUC_009705 [Coccomyxa viridis]|uniref:Uncharacterized protein n=1 Tax=Coccomyxa viridis TaxID=1274662 RepID=A0AAV1IJW4_9CHLO|nr:hypothetical protein CVIRNUC_009705 [Coccomyxa viridis]
MRADFQEFDKRASDLQKVQGRMFMHPEGSQTFRKEQDFEQRTGNNYFWGYRSESITYYGQTPGLTLPQQMQPGMHAGFASLGLLVTIFMIGAYLAVAARLASIWKRTRYSQSHAARAILLWPFLALFSQKFRREIRKAPLRQQNHMENDKGEMA